MIERRHSAQAGAILYLILGAMAAAILLIWVGRSPISTIRALPSAAGAVRLFALITALSLGSLVMGVVLLRKPPGTTVVGFSIVLAGACLLWNMIALILWLVPVPFVWGGRVKSQ